MSVHFDMELRQPVSLQHMLEQTNKKTTAFSTVRQTGCRIISSIKCLQCTNMVKKRKKKKMQFMYYRRSREFTHDMGKILQVDKHTQHTTVSVCVCVANQAKQLCQSLMTNLLQIIIRLKYVRTNRQRAIF